MVVAWNLHQKDYEYFMEMWKQLSRPIYLVNYDKTSPNSTNYNGDSNPEAWNHSCYDLQSKFLFRHSYLFWKCHACSWSRFEKEN
ncbi:MAG: hypothetical protein CXT78_14450 [Thaumarchaeota archaeon]|nr:MAG: hypothetical protein CXT78_14450 [Nitrososphaerota archaeon]